MDKRDCKTSEQAEGSLRGLYLGTEMSDVIGNFFKRYGSNFVDWPHRNCCNIAAPPNGYAFVIFKNERAVRRLIYASDLKHGKLFIDMKDGDVQVKTVVSVMQLITREIW
ncbi:hypothetical protein WUBG_06235 [Wuchereria bancrofti]|uniref:RRM domain-containing protein n=1 Tax=Wuchereria bancrofti TaxID=6293 RepID=J9B731_WUCBA|nr:hypothetical protein WUBG_06235 [Wuchereria bancrofti]